MSSLDTLQLSSGAAPAELWRSVAGATHDWLDRHRLFAGDAVMLLPFVELLAPARLALAESKRWLPRLHTTRTLAAALAPPRERGAGEVTGDAAVDSATARQLLRGHAWVDAWLQRDARAFDAALHALVHTAQTLANAAAALHPDQRAAWWGRARERALAHAGPGGTDRLLLRTAIEWAALGSHADSDRLFTHQSAAWIVVTFGGDDALAQAVARAAAARGTPVLVLNADPLQADPFDASPSAGAIEVETAADAEAEATATAWRVHQLLHDGVVPVALIAQDRALVRRVRALLERLAIAVVDETGWSLATTRAGSHAAAALRAVRTALPDDRLDWLKADLDTTAGDDLVLLERLWRGQRIDDAAPRVRAAALWQREQARLEAFAMPRRRPLGRWLSAFDALLFGASHSAAWRDDAAAQQLRQALRLGDAAGAGAGAWQAATALSMSLDEFTAWVDGALEAHAFIPPTPQQPAPVVITPLARAIGRPFAAAVLPGADANRLGVLPFDASLLDEPARRALVLPDRALRRRRGELAFMHLLRLPRVVLLHRQVDGEAPVSVSPWVERLMRARARHVVDTGAARSARLPEQEVQRSPIVRPAPQAARSLPPSLSASAVEALRQCPYRFFSRVVLHLSEQDELDAEVDKRDAGRWLHATLERFHAERAGPREADAEIAALIEAGHAALRALEEQGEVSAEGLLPFSAGLALLAQRYVDWLHATEADGWRFEAAELSAKVELPDAQGLRLHGRIDRVDARAAGREIRLIDYKTQSRQSLREKVAMPLEDTQLVVYAALQLGRGVEGDRLQACYLALEEQKADLAVEHPQVAHSAQILIHAIAGERARIEAGAPLPALGEGRVCELCEARGLCRRDHWVAQTLEPADAD
jgi:ATP-dependent helicase/nuclease subunit B